MDNFTYSSSGVIAVLDVCSHLPLRDLDELIRQLVSLQKQRSSQKKGKKSQKKKIPKISGLPEPIIWDDAKDGFDWVKDIPLHFNPLDNPLQSPQEKDPACNGDSKPTKITKEQLDRELDEIEQCRKDWLDLRENLIVREVFRPSHNLTLKEIIEQVKTQREQ
jgi:hypothetical protein